MVNYGYFVSKLNEKIVPLLEAECHTQNKSSEKVS